MNPDALASLIVLTVKQALAPLRTSLAALDATAAALTASTATHAAQLAELAALRERLAVLETRAPVAGPPGRDGLDGLALDDLTASFDGDRTLTLTLATGARAKAIPIVLPIPRWQGPFVDGRRYAIGDLVTHDGSVFHCQMPTTRRPSDDPARDAPVWRLMVKRGKDANGRRPAAGGI